MENAGTPLQSLKNSNQKSDLNIKPRFYRLTDEKNRKEFDEILKKPGLILTDEIFSQVRELIKIKHPGRQFSTNELESETKKHFNGLDEDDYGVWIYYSWSNRLVHSVDEEEFVTLRTSRNKYKITDAEQKILAGKKVGVIGLSVGQSVSLTMAMERGCGELRLADFDTLELTNLNRIRSGIHNLGIPKVFAVAREIAEIDPFLRVVCFEKGINEHNMNDFFLANGKLDLLIEESDGFDIKILSRYKARELGVPVIMEGSDRCAVDVERFDLEPQRSILHGLVDHLDISRLKDLKTTEQKVPYLLDILGIDSSSLKLRASMLEIDQTINTWPQLASSVAMGGGITADVSRRMLLNQYTESGRYHIDIEELIGNQQKVKTEQNGLSSAQRDFRELGKKMVFEILPKQENLAKPVVEKLVTAGCLAPSGGNCQPWRWCYSNSTLMLFNVLNGNEVMLGYGDISTQVTMGAAIENVELAACELGFDCRYELFPTESEPDLVAVFRFFKGANPKNVKERVKAIPVRLTNRMLGERVPLNEQVLDKLSAACTEIEGVSLRFFTKNEELERIGDILGELEKIRLLEKLGHRDFIAEIRWTEEESEKTCDGVDLRTLDITNTELAGLKMSKDARVIDLLNEWHGGGAFKKLMRKSVDAAGAVGVMYLKTGSPVEYINAGRALQRIWLDATSQGVAFQPIAASVFVYARLLKGMGIGLSESGIMKLKKLRPEYEKALLIAPGSSEIFIFRLSKAKDPKVKSLRKPLEETFSYF